MGTPAGPYPSYPVCLVPRVIVSEGNSLALPSYFSTATLELD